MKKPPVITLVVIVCLFSISCGEILGPTAGVPKQAPDFALPDLQHNTVVLSDHRDKQAVILIFWTTWCPSCRSALKYLDKLSVDLDKEGWAVYAVNVRESEDKINDFIKKQKISFPVLADKDGSATDAYNIPGVPSYAIVDKKGDLVLRTSYFPNKGYRAKLLK